MASPLLLLLLLLASAAALVLEDGYTVSTAADLNPSDLHPYALLPRPRAGDLLLWLLDSAGSAIYTLALPVSAGPHSLAGPADAFHRPRSVAVDGADNVYVADRTHGAIRKIAPSGETSLGFRGPQTDVPFLPISGLVTTIAGGNTSGTGRRDGPAQNATFSADFELDFVPKICALLVADRGNGLIRQINLKPQDCAHDTQTGLGTTPVSIIAILCALFGSVIGFVLRHFYPIHEVSINRFFSRIQKQYKRTQRKVALISFYDARSVAVSSMLYALLHKLVRVCLGYLSVMLPSVRLERVPYEPAPSLLDLDNPGSGSTATRIGLEDKALPSTEHLGDFIGFDRDADIKEGNESALSATAQEDEEPPIHSDLLVLLDGNQEGSSKKIDSMIQANLSGFSGQEKYSVSAANCSGVSRRRLLGDTTVL